MSPIEEKLHDALDTLRTRDDFVRFVGLLIESFKEARPPWNNATVDSYLAELAYGASKLEAFYESASEGAQNVASPSWEAVAGMLFSARCAHVSTQSQA